MTASNSAIVRLAKPVADLVEVLHVAVKLTEPQAGAVVHSEGFSEMANDTGPYVVNPQKSWTTLETVTARSGIATRFQDIQNF